MSIKIQKALEAEIYKMFIFFMFFLYLPFKIYVIRSNCFADKAYRNNAHRVIRMEMLSTW